MRFASRVQPAWLTVMFLLVLFFTSPAWSQDELLAPSWTSVTVGVADLDKALELWVGVFGFSKLAEVDGEDEELAALWRLLPSDIKRQALLGMPGAAYGKLHLVEFTEPGPAVREGAKSYDLGPNSLAVYTRNLPERVKEMQAKGLTFRTAEPSEFLAPDGSSLRVIHLPAHDETNVVLLEMVGENLDFNPQGFTGIGSLISVVQHGTTEAEFYTKVLGLKPLGANQLEGAEIERLIDLPQGTLMDVSLWGQSEQPLGLIELVDYLGVRSVDLFPVAVPTQLGILHVSYEVTDLDAFRQRLYEAGLNHSDREYREVIFGSGRFIRLRSPAGMTLEVFE